MTNAEQKSFFGFYKMITCQRSIENKAKYAQDTQEQWDP
jgi:hypothetical protein